MERATSRKYTSTPESLNFAKLTRLFVELLRDVLWETLTKRILPEELPEKVRKNKEWLAIAGRMREDQYRRICKSGGGEVSNEDFDISLLYMLLRNLPMEGKKIQRPSKKWGSDVYPEEKNKTEGDDIERIRLRRNQVFEQMGKASLSKDEFDQIWADMLAVVKRFDIRLKTDFESEMEVILKDETDRKVDDLVKAVKEKKKEVTDGQKLKMERATSRKYTSTPESLNFAKLTRLFVELLRDVLWETLTKRILPEELPDRVRKNKKRLETAGRMREDQYRRICRSDGGDISNEDFDITLLYMLLRILPLEGKKIQRPSKKWGSDVYPEEKNKTEGDDIERIRLRRNQFFEQMRKASLSKDEFDQIWADMLAVVKRFDIRLKTNFESEMEVILKDETDRKVDDLVKAVKEEKKGLPFEILQMDKRSQQLYREALEAGKEKVYNIRLMIVGHLGVGKTTLTKRILGEDVAETPHVSTEGIEVHRRCCKIDLDTKEWTVERKEHSFPDNGQRLVNIVSEHVANKSKTLKEEVSREENNSIQYLLTNTEQVQKGAIYQKGMDSFSIGRAVPVSLESNKEMSESDVMRTVTNSTSDKNTLDDDEEDNIHGKQSSLEPDRSQSGQTDSNETNILDTENNTGINDTMGHSDFLDFVTKYGTLTHSEKTFCYVTMLDFAGQFVFYTTHQAFMSWRTLYLLVTDMSKSLDDLVSDTCNMNLNRNIECSIRDYAIYWLNSIYSHGIPTDTSPQCERSIQRETGNDEQNLDGAAKYPPVILVATHSDKVPKEQKDKIKNKYFDGVRRILTERPQRFLLKGYFATGKFESDADIDALKQKIVELAKEQDYWGEEIPARWLALEHKLMELKRSGVKIIEYSIVEEINTSSDVKIENPDELEVFLRFEHDLGNIVFFNTEKLRDKVVLDPDWLIDGVRILISPPRHVIEDPDIYPQWNDFRDKGRLTKHVIGRLWSEGEHEDFHKNREHLLDLMEKLSIIAKPVKNDGGVQDQEQYYWVPCVIYKSAPDHVKNPEPHEGMTRTSTLCFVSKTKFIHVGIFHRLVASFLSKWQPGEEDGEYRLYGGCCEFEVDDCHSLLLALNDYVILATMYRYSSGGECPDNGLCSDIKKLISSTLDNISACISPNSKFDICVKCDRSSTYTTKGLLAISNRKEIRCKCSKPLHTAKLENLLQFWKQKKNPVEEEQIYSGTSDLTRHEEPQVSLRRSALPLGKKYHVFFSYSSSDIQWVRKTVETLENDHGICCCEYDRDNTPGTPLLKFAGDSIKNAYKTVIVMTREALQSGYVLHEIEMALNHGFQERRKCVVPVLLEDCEVPSHLSILNYVDARDPKRRDIWWPKLLIELEVQAAASVATDVMKLAVEKL